MSNRGTQFRSVLLVVVGMLLVLAAIKATTVAQADIEERNRRAIQEAFDNWRRGGGKGVYDLLASDVKWTITGRSAVAGTYHSRRDFMDQVAIPFNARLSTPIVPTVRGLYTDGDMVIVLWDGAALARDGKQYENTYSWYLKMRDGKIVSATSLEDPIAFNELWKGVRPVY